MALKRLPLFTVWPALLEMFEEVQRKYTAHIIPIANEEGPYRFELKLIGPNETEAIELTGSCYFAHINATKSDKGTWSRDITIGGKGELRLGGEKHSEEVFHHILPGVNIEEEEGQMVLGEESEDAEFEAAAPKG